MPGAGGVGAGQVYVHFFMPLEKGSVWCLREN